ncbi:MAG: WYL domain-containing protein [Treponemataceae bacterium]|nr:WYL domain-containing protein [Treponemataceae bacterium]
MAMGVKDYRRIMAIDRLLSSGRHYGIDELCKAVESEFSLYEDSSYRSGFDKKTIYKVIKAMKEELELPIGNDADGFFYTEDSGLSGPAFLSRSETYKTLEMLENLLEAIKDSPVYEEASSLMKDLSMMAPLKKSFGNSYSKKKEIPAGQRIVFLGAPATDIHTSTWNTINKAMENNYYLKIVYRPAGRENTIHCGYKPYQLIFDNGIWNVWGYDMLNKEKKQFNLTRIVSVELTDETFELPDDYDFHNVTPGTFGVYRDYLDEHPGMVTYKIWFRKSSYAEKYATERKWGNPALDGSPFVEQVDDGSIISFSNNQFLPILRWVLGWGSDAKPLEPEVLVEKWQENIKKMCEKL